MKKRSKKKATAHPKQEVYISWKVWVVVSATLLATLGALVIVLLTPRGQQPEEWALQSWMQLWDVFFTLKN